MYAGTTLRPMKHFDAWFGTHQKIDRVARQHLAALLPKSREFPNRREIIKFEGFDGPDGIKRKTPAQDELWHFINPEDDQDRQIIPVLQHNYQELVAALKEGNHTRFKNELPEQLPFQPAQYFAHTYLFNSTERSADRDVREIRDRQQQNENNGPAEGIE